MVSGGTREKWSLLKPHFEGVRAPGARHARSIEEVIDDLPEFPPFRGEAWEVVPNGRSWITTVGEGAQARQGPRRRKGTEPAYAAAKAGAVVVQADMVGAALRATASLQLASGTSFRVRQRRRTGRPAEFPRLA